MLLTLSACRTSQAATEPSPPSPPPGEVWLTSEQAKGEGIEVEVAQERILSSTLLTGGRVAFDDARVGHVFSPVTGRVVRICAALGQRVKRGDPLAVIESPDLGDAVSDMRKARADLVAAQHDHDRQQSLLAEHATSQASLEQSEDTWRRARAESQRARQRVYLLRASDSDTNSPNYTLVAPVDGEVLARNVSPGVEIQGQYGPGAAQELFTIGDLSRVWVLGDVYETDIGKVRVGSPVELTLLAYKDRVFTGTIDWVSTVLDPITRTATVRCALDNGDGALRPEMYATLQMPAEGRRGLAVPRRGLLAMGEHKLLFIQLDDAGGRSRFARIPVDVRDDDGESAWLEVRHGVELGQRIVVGGVKQLSLRL